jgi:lysyl-tRNA synthetase class 2
MKPEKKPIQLTEEEKAVLALLKEQSPIGLIELKEKAGLSNKKWDVSIKGLTKNMLATVTKIGDDLVVELV